MRITNYLKQKADSLKQKAASFKQKTKLICASVFWLILIGLGVTYLAHAHSHWLSAHRQAIVAVVVVLGLLAGVFLLAAWLAPKGESQPQDDRLKLQNDIRTTIFQAIAALAVFVGAFVAWQQLQSNRSETQATNALVNQEQVAQAFGQAVGEFASTQIDVQVGGMYALQQIFEAGQNSQVAPTNPVIIRIRPAVFGLLTTYIRTHAPSPSDSPLCDRSVSKTQVLSERMPAVQVALNILGTRGYGASNEPNLFIEHADLRNADLYGSFDDTDFSYSNLGGADFKFTDLGHTNFTNTDLCGANLVTAVNYSRANFQGAVADGATKFPKGFKPEKLGIIMKR